MGLTYKNGLLLLLSRFSRVRLCANPWTAAHQAPPSLGFSRQEHWSGLPSPSPMHESEKWKWSRSVVSDSSWSHGLHAAYQAPPSMGVSRQEYRSGVPLPSSWNAIHPYIIVCLPTLQTELHIGKHCLYSQHLEEYLVQTRHHYLFSGWMDEAIFSPATLCFFIHTIGIHLVCSEHQKLKRIQHRGWSWRE